MEKDFETEKRRKEFEALARQSATPKGAAERVLGQIDYRLGRIIVRRSSSLRGWLGMPKEMFLEVQRHRTESTPEHMLPPLDQYIDAHDAERVKRHLSYRLGNALVINGKNPVRWPLLPLALYRAYREFQAQQTIVPDNANATRTQKRDMAGNAKPSSAASKPNGAAAPPSNVAARDAAPIHYYLNPNSASRLPVNTMVAGLADYDVISFDIFDTALVRTVTKPNDVFRVMGLRLRVTDFVSKRKDAEAQARLWNDRVMGTREVTLDEIYQVLSDRYGATDEWKQLEKDLEIKMARPNPYILEVYGRLREMGKTIIFTSDMYLPKDTIEAMLSRCGYKGYEKIYLSNEHKARKGDGTLQKILLADYGSEKSIVHVGDVFEADVEKTNAAGITGVFNHDQRVLAREKDMASLAGSVYQAVIDNAIGTGTWSNGLHYTHGFRVGGILALGYVEFLERVAKEKGIEKILFLGRDCDVLFKIYRRFFGRIPSAYVETSRIVTLMLTTERNFDDYINRTFFRWYKESDNSRPLRQILEDTGFGYLVDHLEDLDLEPLQFPASANEQHIREFFWSKKSVIEQANAETRQIAKEYYSEAIGDAKKVLSVDIGWTGTCITGMRDFFQIAFGEEAPEVYGALMGTSRNEQVFDAITSGLISAYVYSPVMNQDITRLMIPGGRIPQKRKDLLTHPVEYLFTEPDATAISYVRDETGKPVALRGGNTPPNATQILDMQQGIIDFVDCYLDYSKEFSELRAIPPYVAFQPLRNSLGYQAYLYEVYKDFVYDAAPVQYADASMYERFGNLFDAEHRGSASCQLEGRRADTENDPAPPRILFVSPEMKYVGAPRSLLRLCKVAVELGYEPIVWTAKSGPFVREFEKEGFPVEVVSAAEVDKARIEKIVRDNVKLVVCNTVVTDGFVSVFEGKLPVVWYVREASNVPQFLRGNPKRAEMLRRSSSLTVVSDYAAAAIGAYADGPIEVVKNAVEDLADLAPPYVPAKDGIIRFVQLGTIEHRKGYDLFLAAFKAMPEEYQARAELHFAGGFINSATSFASYIFGQLDDNPRIKYHGLISSEQQKVTFYSQMDVVVVASRDESCSLVALEGAMLSKPLIVSENVGAKYIVNDSNGIVFQSGKVDELRNAFMRMIDLSADELRQMGEASRENYDKLASMRNHRRELGELFARRIATGPIKSLPAAQPTVSTTSETAVTGGRTVDREIIVSLTSFPPRMPTIAACVESLKNQSKRPDRIILWLSEDQFPRYAGELPVDLRNLVDKQFEIRWVEGDIAPHKKYFYAMQEYPEAHVITVDDDVRYDRSLVETLYKGHLDRPSTIVAGRANLIRFRPNGTFRTYDRWAYDYKHLRETETYELLPTGIGGVLYPSGSIPPEAFDIEAIRATCLHADDLWLKLMATANGYPTWVPQHSFNYRNIDGSQQAALWRTNSFKSGNDEALEKTLGFFRQRYGIDHDLICRIRGIRKNGTIIGPGDEIDRFSLLKTTREDS